MTKEQLALITETVEGHKVKSLRWLPTDNIITGLVECPMLEKVVSGMWRKSGVPTNRIKGRKEFILKIDLVDSN
jgi:hypothetical protein